MDGFVGWVVVAQVGLEWVVAQVGLVLVVGLRFFDFFFVFTRKKFGKRWYAFDSRRLFSMVVFGM